jgi:hypothetical protein
MSPYTVFYFSQLPTAVYNLAGQSLKFIVEDDQKEQIREWGMHPDLDICSICPSIGISHVRAILFLPQQWFPLD